MLDLSITSKEPYDLYSERVTRKITGRIILYLDVADKTSADISLVSSWKNALFVQMTDGATSDVTESISDQVSQFSTQGLLYQLVEPLVMKLKTFQQVMETLSEERARDRSYIFISDTVQIYPFLTIAWKLASALFSIVQNVPQTHPKMIDLVRSMDDAFAFVDHQMLEDKVAGLQQPIDGLLKQTIECCLFVSCCASRGFLSPGRMLDITSTQKIDEFERALANFKRQIDSGVVVYTSVVSMRTPRKIDDLMLRQRLNPSLSEAFSRPTCLPNTRVEVRQKIIDWIFSGARRNIFWLHGVAGSGKSAVSTTIAQHFRDMSRLGAFLFFETGKSESSSVIRTIAYSLAMLDSTIGGNILGELEEDKEIITASPGDQFRKLLLKPLLNAGGFCGPIVIVLDALDECGTPDTRRGLLDLLQKEFPKLPGTFRFLITSRRAADIDKAFSSYPETVYSIELDHTSSASQQDVLSYLNVEMRRIVGHDVPNDWDWDEKLSLLGNAAGGLFAWASRAVSLVRFSDVPLHTIDSLASDPLSLCQFGLYELYESVLRDSWIDWGSENARNRFGRVTSLLISNGSPISIEEIDSTLGFRSFESSRLILSRIQSILTHSGGFVSLFHPSLKAYFSSSECSSKPWFIESDVSGQSMRMEKADAITLETETDTIYQITVIDPGTSAENETIEQTVPIEEDAEIKRAMDSLCTTPAEQDIAELCTGCTVQVMDQFIGTVILEDTSRIDHNTLQRNVDIAYSIMSHVEPRQAQKLERFLRLAAQKRTIFASNIFLNGIRVSSRIYVDGGGFADVFKGWHNGKLVALKVLRILPSSTMDEIHVAFVKEALVWRKLDHPNVLPFLGICRDAFEPQMALVSHWMEKGNLFAYLKNTPSADCLKLSLGVARGLEYLHSLKPQVIHGDLRAVNVLIDDSNEPRIADFGLVRVIDSQSFSNATSFQGIGAHRWLAPELLDVDRFGKELHKLTTKSDVYAFSCIFTGEFPYFGLHEAAVFIAVAVRDKRPPRPGQVATEKGLTDDVWSIMQDCWKTWPNERPDMLFVVSQLEEVVSIRESSETEVTPASE
ncbi:hypothetical protein ACEPAI_1618 [Sanghuangporus weigelae]